MILPEEIDESLNVPWKDHGQGHQSVEQQGRSWRVNILKYKDDLRYSKKVGSPTWTYKRRSQRWYFGKLMATGSLFLDIDSLGGIDSVMELIPRRNWFLEGIYSSCMKISQWHT